MNDAYRFRTAVGSLLVAAGALVAPATRAATLTGNADTDLTTETIVDGLGSPTDIAILPDGRLVVTQKGGDVAIVTPGAAQVDGHINVNPVHNEQGLLGIVPDPNFTQNHYLYVFADTDPDTDNKHKFIRYELDDDGTLTQSMILVDMGLLGPANHNGGGIIIDENYIYFSVGDTGHNATPPNNRLGTCLNSPNGKILRVSLADGSIPNDNPLVGEAMVTGCDAWDADLALTAPDTRIFAWGFRNPFRFWVDPMTKKLWVGDVGEEAREEVVVGDGGQHFGWPFFEGTVEYNQTWNVGCEGVTPATACVPTAHEYDHSNGRNAIMGGRILDACGWPAAWKSRYIFGDHGSGEAWTLEVNPARDGLVNDTSTPFGDFNGPAAFRVGPDNALYVVEEGGGTVQKITPKQTVQENCAAPPTGGAGGTGGSGGTNSGGTDPGNAGTPGGGATSSAGSGTGGASTGGSGGPVGGSNAGGTGATGPNGAASSSDEGGCGCRVGGSAGAPAGLALLAGALGLLWGRRQRRSRERITAQK